ncbi:unnamed protein product, partial [Vitrella brassicaformis CCMP3155]
LITDSIQGGTDETKLATFLKDKFIDKANRYLIFTSHTTTTGGKLSTFITSPSDRDVIRPRLPVITSTEEAQKLTSEAHKGALCFLGLAPALVHTVYNTKRRNVRRAVEGRFSALSGPPRDKKSLSAVISTAITGTGMMTMVRELGDWAQCLDGFISKDEGESVYVWSPCYLVEAYEALERSTRDLDQDVAEGMLFFVDCLRQLIEAEQDSGKEWEGVCAAAFMQRLLESHLLWDRSIAIRQGQLTPDAKELLPEAVLQGCRFGGVFRPTKEDIIKEDGFSADYERLREKFLLWLANPTRALKNDRAAFFVKPVRASFPKYDFFIFIVEDGTVVKIYGYQCKTNPKNTPTKDAETDFADKSFWLFGTTGDDRKESQQWIIPSQDAFVSLAGFSLSRTCPPFMLIEEDGGELWRSSRRVNGGMRIGIVSSSPPLDFHFKNKTPPWQPPGPIMTARSLPLQAPSDFSACRPTQMHSSSYASSSASNTYTSAL